MNNPGIVRNRLKIEAAITQRARVSRVPVASTAASRSTCGASSAASRSRTAVREHKQVPATSAGIGCAEQGSQAARLPLRRQHDHLRAHAGDRHGERSSDELLSLQGVQGARASRATSASAASRSLRRPATPRSILPLPSERRVQLFERVSASRRRTATAGSRSRAPSRSARAASRRAARVSSSRRSLRNPEVCSAAFNLCDCAPALIGYHSAKTPFGQRDKSETQRPLDVREFVCRLRTADRSARARDSRAAADRSSALHSRRRRRPIRRAGRGVACFERLRFRRSAARPEPRGRRRAARRARAAASPDSASGPRWRRASPADRRRRSADRAGRPASRAIPSRHSPPRVASSARRS